MTMGSFFSSSGSTLVTSFREVRSGERARERQALEHLAGGRRFTERTERIADARDAHGDDRAQSRIALHAQHEAASRRIFDHRARDDALARDLHRLTQERDGGVPRERLEDVPDARHGHDVARRRAEDAIDAHVLVGRRERAERAPQRERGGTATRRGRDSRPSAVHDNAREREELPLRREAIRDVGGCLGLGTGAEPDAEPEADPDADAEAGAAPRTRWSRRRRARMGPPSLRSRTTTPHP